jgi:hypothetical protein
METQQSSRSNKISKHNMIVFMYQNENSERISGSIHQFHVRKTKQGHKSLPDNWTTTCRSSNNQTRNLIKLVNDRFLLKFWMINWARESFRNQSHIPEQVTYPETCHLFRDKDVIPGQVIYSGTSPLFRNKSLIREQVTNFGTKQLPESVACPEFARLFVKPPPSRTKDSW